MFIISHNDNFVSTIKSDEIMFINEENKQEGQITTLNDLDVDKLHLAMGGVVSSLTSLQKSKKIIFVEGEDDITYIQNLVNKLKQLNLESAIYGENFSKKSVCFWHTRGKDYLKLKLTNYKNLISQLITSRREFLCIFDKDFSSITSAISFSQSINQMNIRTHNHRGYCIESILFSDLSILNKLIHTLADEKISITDVEEYITTFCNTNIENICTVTSTEYNDMHQSFIGQKKESRPEMSNVDFPNFLQDLPENIHYLMNKSYIKKFIHEFESQFSISLNVNEDDTNESFASGLLNSYINSIQSVDDVYPDMKQLLVSIYIQ